MIEGKILNGIVCPTMSPGNSSVCQTSKTKLEERNVRTTYMAKAGEVERKWYVVDATDVPLGRKQFTKLNVYGGAEHPHAAQQPEVLDITNLI